jgi:hypothetical protein
VLHNNEVLPKVREELFSLDLISMQLTQYCAVGDRSYVSLQETLAGVSLLPEGGSRVKELLCFYYIL